MNSNEQVLDQPFVAADGEKFVKINLASTGQRFGNYIIDLIIFYVLIFAYGGMLGVTGVLDSADEFTGLWVVSIYLIPFIYYVGMESVFGKTVGKFVTGTKVVTVKGETATFMNIIGRTFCRLIPFEAFSFFGSTAVGWHDSLPGTRVIRDR